MFVVYHYTGGFQDIPTSVRETETLRDWIRNNVALGNFVAAAIVDSFNADDVFRLTNHIDTDWTTNNEVTMVPPHAKRRSTSVGDFLLELETGIAYGVASIGFVNLQFRLK